MTLPLIYALGQSDEKTKNYIIGLIKNSSDKPAKVAEVVRFIHEKQGIAYAKQAMERLKNEAFLLLDQFPANVYRESLRELVKFTVDRRK